MPIRTALVRGFCASLPMWPSCRATQLSTVVQSIHHRRTVAGRQLIVDADRQLGPIRPSQFRLMAAGAGNRVVAGQARIKEEQFFKLYLLHRQGIVLRQVLSDLLFEAERNGEFERSRGSEEQPHA